MLVPTVRKPNLAAASFGLDKAENTLGVLHPFSQLLPQPPLLLKAAISSLQQFGDIGNLSAVISSSLPQQSSWMSPPWQLITSITS